MALVPIENKTDFPKHVAGMIIPPHETRFIDESLLPRHHKPKLAVIAQAEPAVHDLIAAAHEAMVQRLTDMLEMPVKAILAVLHTFTLDELNLLDVMEQSDKNRKSLIQGFTEERLRRAGDENDPDLSSVEKYIRIHRIDTLRAPIDNAVDHLIPVTDDES